MNSSDLQLVQVAALRAAIGRNLRYLNKIYGRCHRLGCPVDDPVVKASHRAREAMQDLFTAVGYAGQSHGVGRSEGR
jgi:hypothetical protein